jgi:hypothetical protein
MLKLEEKIRKYGWMNNLSPNITLGDQGNFDAARSRLHGKGL